MTVSANKAALNAAIDLWNKGDVDGYMRIYTDNVVYHELPPGFPAGYQGVRMFYEMFLGGFPQAKLVIDNVVEEGDKIACTFELNATHDAAFMGIPATGKAVRLVGITVMRFEGGRIAERWNQADMGGLMQTIGAA